LRRPPAYAAPGQTSRSSNRANRRCNRPRWIGSFEDPSSPPGKSVLTADDNKFLDDLEQRGIRFFVDEQDSVTGLMPDRSLATGGAKDVASIASVGFGITALCIGDERGWIAHQDAYDRSLRVLRFLRERGPQEHGHFFHFLNMRTGQRVWNCEVSNIDTALLMAGVLTVRQHFAGTELASLANELYERVDWPWLMRGSEDPKTKGLVRMGWNPEHGFLESDWGQFSEGPPLIILLGMGSRTHPLPPETWRAWRREPVMTYAGLTFVQCPPLFTQQYPQCWFDLRGQHDDHADYSATRNWRRGAAAMVHGRAEQAVRDVRPERVGHHRVGRPQRIQSLGGPSPDGKIDADINGVVVPCAAGGSLAFEPRLCLDALQEMKKRYGENAYLKYGFVDAFNPRTIGTMPTSWASTSARPC